MSASPMAVEREECRACRGSCVLDAVDGRVVGMAGTLVAREGQRWYGGRLMRIVSSTIERRLSSIEVAVKGC